MTLALTVVAEDDSELLDAHFAFHLSAGVDVVIAIDRGLSEAASEVLEQYVRDGWARRLTPESAAPESSWQTRMARVAIADFGAEWIIPSALDEFWWPRGESLAEVLAVIPKRYAVVQALVRTFVANPGERRREVAGRTARTSLLGSEGSTGGSVQERLRPVYRAETNIVIDSGDWTLGGRRVPLRAWYPIEVLRFPNVASAHLDDWTLVEDSRLRDALRTLRDAAPDHEERGFALPSDGAAGLTFPVPSIVDDASYAIECAAVGEVDLVRLDSQIRELELRIAALEARFWPRVRRTVRRLARRPS